MADLLHLWALAPATLGACCVAADRGRARAPELAASVLMVLAMADAATGSRMLAPVLCAALLVVAAMALAAVRGRRRSAAAHPAPAMSVMTTLGLVVMAALTVAMGVHGAGHATGHAHGVGAPGLALGVGAVTAAYVGAAGVLAVRGMPRLDRVQYAAMGASTLLMGLAALV
ncbi:hypothetical protein [uncultured Microbacterium sp.]|uniref:tRNA-dihydrouridine synthase n=1 Tax=uncultured Microbacterium sp. TaxID=191216 RepID=A0A1Y5NZR8_9MICO|nr:hypothetical protein [uncultured Microbacterium sp.]SBS71947.1 tRNA-dihydrouridine synthase [uncultured Microbacterium sp.]